MTTGSVAEQAGASSSLRVVDLLDRAEQARRRGDYRSGVELAHRAAGLAGILGDEKAQAGALRSLATQRLRLGEHEQAVNAYSDALALLEGLHDEAGRCQTLTAQAMPFNLLGLHEEALDALARAREIAQRLNDTSLLYWVHNRMGVVHASMGDHETSTECFMRALTIVEGMDDEARFCILNNLGDNAVNRVPQLLAEGRVAEGQGMIEDALGYIERALEFARSAGHPYRESIAVDNCGMLHALTGDYDTALRMIEESRVLAVAHGYRSLELAALQHLAKVRLMQGECDAAIEGLRAALEWAVKAGEKPMAMEIHRELSEAYERTGDTAAALRHYKLFHQVEREVHNDVAAARARMMIHNFELDNARLESELHRLRNLQLEADKRVLDRHAHEDALTGLANRRLVELRLPEITAAAREAGRPFCLAIADVDLFKGVNDRFGHLLGDEVLREIATVLKAKVRGDDLVARLGGEEFLFAFEGVDLDDAYRICETLRDGIAEYPWSQLHPGLAVTISIGVVERQDAIDYRVLMARADEQLYQAKRAGRNRVKAG